MSFSKLSTTEGDKCVATSGQVTYQQKGHIFSNYSKCLGRALII